MALTLKTPNVYIEEISKFPPSVADVATAIPAFIGYTQMAKNKIDGDLSMVPTRITSLLDYETYFGFAANETTISVDVSAEGVIVVNGPTVPSPFTMYYNMQMYFANGGGPCYITSVGQFGAGTSPATAVDFDELKDGLDEVKKQDEPTLIVFPDSKTLSEPLFYQLYTLALTQSSDLQDRFTILDTYTDTTASIDALRNGVTNDSMYLKYGAAYFPYLTTILSYSYLDSGVEVNDVNAPTYSSQVNTIASSINSAPLNALLGELEAIRSAFFAIPTPNSAQISAAKTSMIAKITEIKAYLSLLDGNVEGIQGVGQEAIDDNGGTLLNASMAILSGWITSIGTILGSIATSLGTLGAATAKAPINTAVIEIQDLFATTPDSFSVKVNKLKDVDIPAMVLILETSFVNVEAALSDYELNNNVMYNQIKAEIAKVNVILPPSSAIAGIYARIDANKGVWTAPANASLNYTIAPTLFIDNAMQEDMNVTSTGKSVNAIRSFTGRGTLVWGARTLTGNDNEWRYVPVRRFFNMVEESVKKATEPFVFQANNANTWVKIQGMIEAFLTQQWKAGALTGAKPEQAYYVSVGLGKTMTAQDILEGKMIIEIGMAVVRPAEFIVLQFSHKMQEA